MARKCRVLDFDGPTKKRFLSKLDVKGEDECWPWKSGIFNTGYGAFWIRGNNVPAPRAAYQLFVGTLDPDKYVCHHCDNPLCCNPKHLFLATHEENMQDMKNKGRDYKRHGETHPDAKLRAQDVRAMRKEFAQLVRAFKRQKAAQFGMTVRGIQSVLDRTNWKQVA